MGVARGGEALGVEHEAKEGATNLEEVSGGEHT